jgi:SAM-dependent methyltransferase
MSDDPRLDAWLTSLDQRHLAELTLSEVARALRALSSCYVERRAKLARGGALDSAGKRAAFALFYAPLHYLVVREIARALPAPSLDHIVDLGCGTGAAGAAWATVSGAARISGVDRNAWAVAEANRTYETFGLQGRATTGDLVRKPVRGAAGTGILLAYTVNELPDETRARLLPSLLDAARAGSSLLIVEPIARRMSGWWSSWEAAFTKAGGRADEWRFPSHLPERQRALARAAGLDPRELTGRTLSR